MTWADLLPHWQEALAVLLALAIAAIVVLSRE